MFNFFEESLCCFCSSLYHFTFLAEFEDSNFSLSLPIFVVFCSLDGGHPNWFGVMCLSSF